MGNFQDAVPSSAKFNIESVFKVAFGVISILGILMMFFGFGVALALDGFGVDVHQVLHGPGDYLAVAAYVVIELVIRISAQYTSQDWFELVFIYACFGAIAVLALWGAALLTKRWHPLIFAYIKGSSHRKITSFLSKKIFFWRPAAIVAGVAIVGMVIGLLPYLLFILLAFCIVPFLIGVVQANHYLYVSVVEPTACRPFESADVRRAAYFSTLENDGRHGKSGSRPYFATCLKVTSKSGSPQYGRRVIATSEYIVLFSPKTGTVNVVPTKDAIVSLVDKLE